MFSENRRQLENKISGSVAFLHSGSVVHCPGSMDEIYRPDGNFYYVTGIDLPEVLAVVTTVHREHKYVLFFDPPDATKAVWTGEKTTLAILKKISGADEVYPMADLPNKLPDYLKSSEFVYHSLGKNPSFDSALIQTLTQQRRRSSRLIPPAIWELNEILQEMRIIKKDWEIDCIRKSTSITQEGFLQAMIATSPGKYEYEIDAALNHAYRQRGGRSAFPAIVGAGNNATVLHYHQNNGLLRSEDLLLVDSGAQKDYYNSDVTRAWPVNGVFEGAKREVYQAVLGVQKSLIDLIEPGKCLEEFSQESDVKLAEAILDLGLIKGSLEQVMEDKSYKKYYPHTIGHWLGLEVHDLGSFYKQGKARKFTPGMIITVEPGIYIPEEDHQVDLPFRGIGVRIEDDVLVTSEGHEVLSQDIPKEINEIENYLVVS